MPMIENLSLKFGKNQVFNGLGLEIPENEKLAVIGNNGSGKTSLALLLAGVIPDFISAKAGGNYPKDAGLVMQNPASQFFAMTVREELGEKAALAKRLGFEELLERSVFELSEGEKQKINLAANLGEKGLLLLDEPLELLDPVEARRFREIIEKVDSQALLWLDKNESMPEKWKKVYLNGKRKAKLPKKSGNPGSEPVMKAALSVEKGSFQMQGIELELHAREKIALIGLNGSGKSTILKALAGAEKISGKIERKKAISFVPQNPGHIFFHSGFFGEGVAENVERLQIQNLVQKSPEGLSKGMQKMLSIAAAKQGTIALVDEPTTWLDALNKERVYNFIDKSSEAMVIATHDRQLLEYCDRIFLIEKGGMSECSSTAADRFFQK
ncbi:MAG: ATP-binding cassette domain-containing protein [Candidatus Diapherotrites archaeon]|uniref:ATP-binding cassette domain-containing protein n=1 Tax=Candidatus Iainarchaeum sp. TaxID=3101447 RepID=A0A939C535_9ARCH|nr:ATP-binding cassette domain-containing protein [Candidatus Diapherotrites archaeon]